MILGFDHLIHFAYRPDQAMDKFRTLGFNAYTGGRHPNWGTHNCLSFFPGLRYIEWIGIEDDQAAKGSDNVLIQQIVKDSTYREGFSNIALRTNDNFSLAVWLEERGYEIIGPVDGQRRKEDGSLLQWSMLFIKENENMPLRYPFFIQWGETDEQREREMAGMMEHSVGTPSISFIGFNVEDEKEAFHQYASLFSTYPDAVHRRDASGSFIELSIFGDFTIRFYKKRESSYGDASERPVVCGIKGCKNARIEKVNGGTYFLME
ncbi:VOC family protein [Pseudalkalibacillus salsuginis]|uniref:VOC family protein n=1 Tax=Pseudalkalibacillus salsuginis TaxID=2910972 RepID=UPI001F434447|nr:VOC family protein [Pseudalkalibacillus salsuginis]MCF6411748.1 VOC family protein [Pseudalkalibacillus salsuginis]